MKKYIIWALALLILPVSVSAQEYSYVGKEFQDNNVYVTTGATFDFTGDDEKGRLLGAANIGGGIWINKYLGLELTAVFGKSEFPTQVVDAENKFKTYGLDLSYKAYVFGSNSFTRFNLIADLGVGFRQFNAVGAGVEGSYSSKGAINGHFGLQAVYNVTPKLALYVEPMAVLQSKYYDVDNSDDICGTAMVKVGATFTFNDQFKNMKIIPRYNSREKYLSLERKLDALKAEVDKLK